MNIIILFELLLVCTCIIIIIIGEVGVRWWGFTLRGFKVELTGNFSTFEREIQSGGFKMSVNGPSLLWQTEGPFILIRHSIRRNYLYS